MSRSALCLLLAAALMVAVPTARAGAVFEIKEPVDVTPESFRFNFDAKTIVKGAGVIARSNLNGAGKVFETSAIPLAVITLNRCAAVAPHNHPNGAETLFVMEGKIRISQFLENGKLIQTEVPEGCAGYIEQGTIHLVENIHKGDSKVFQLFDHPFAGSVFTAPAVAALPRNVVNSAFSEPVIEKGVMGFGGLIHVKDCEY